jgi:PAS domain S-box-containing protein
MHSVDARAFSSIGVVRRWRCGSSPAVGHEKIKTHVRARRRAFGRMTGLSELLEAQNEVIDAIARCDDLHQTLCCIATIVERLLPETTCSILVLDSSGERLRHGGAPSLPDWYNSTIDGMTIGPQAGSCGTAAFRRERVIVEDIETDPLWRDYRHLVRPLGFRACWSQPILDEKQALLGTFALYCRESRAPGACDLALIDGLGRLVRVAMVQNRREKALQETEQRLRDYVSVASDWLWEQDADHRLTFLSRNAGALDSRTLLGKLSWQAFFDGVDPATLNALQEHLAARKPFRDFHVVRRGANGRIHALNISGMPIYDEDGAFCGYRGVAQDVSKQATAENASRAAKLQAVEANRAKTEFLANISHELRTPLNAILGFSEIMKEAMLGPISPRYQEYATDIHNSGQYLDGLVTNLLDLSRIEMGRVDLSEDVVDIATVIDHGFRLLKMRAEEQGIDLVVETPPDGLMVRCDKLRIKQALVNLLSNAVKFTPRGGFIKISAELAPCGLAIRVRDNGIGMRPDDIAIAVEPFRQIDPLLSRRFGGVGLGLALAKSLVELHGGRLELESAVAAGTVATIYLPTARVLKMAVGSDAG